MPIMNYFKIMFENFHLVESYPYTNYKSILRFNALKILICIKEWNFGNGYSFQSVNE